MPMAGNARVRAGREEYPALGDVAHRLLLAEDVGEFPGDGLLPHPRLGLGDVQPTGVEIELVETRPQDFAVPHRRVEAERHE